METDGEGESIESAELILGARIPSNPPSVVRDISTASANFAAASAPTYDDVRQLAVVVWARTKLIEHVIAADGSRDARVLAGLAEIGAAITAIGAHLDRLEDASTTPTA